ncbi:MAG TPA: hypothetical protein PK694_00680 [Rhodospirillales bacterium]|nr:hypothetical protein [Rhodospirillales bacterium]
MWPFNRIRARNVRGSLGRALVDFLFFKLFVMLMALSTSAYATGMSMVDGVASQWGTLGYVIVFLSVAFAVCLLFLMMSATAWLWGHRSIFFNGGHEIQHIPAKNGARDFTEEVSREFASGGNGGASRALLPRAAEQFEPLGLYIGLMEVEHRLTKDGVLKITVGGFNASGCAIDIREVRGRICATVVVPRSGTRDTVLTFQQMPTPNVVQSLSAKPLDNIPNLSDFLFDINQIVPANMHDEVLGTSPDRAINLTFLNLNVMAYPTNGTAAGCRLPLWDAVTFRLPSGAEYVKVYKDTIVTGLAAGGKAGAGIG